MDIEKKAKWDNICDIWFDPIYKEYNTLCKNNIQWNFEDDHEPTKLGNEKIVSMKHYFRSQQGFKGVAGEFGNFLFDEAWRGLWNAAFDTNI